MTKLLSAIIFFALVMIANDRSFAVTADAPVATNVTDFTNGHAVAPDKMLPRSGCITQTGSSIKVKDNRVCNGEFGSAYNKEDIESTGALTIADALQRLDTAVQIRR